MSVSYEIMSQKLGKWSSDSVSTDKEDGFDGKSRRVHERGDDQAIKLKIAGKTYVCINWSLGGFLIEGYDGGLTMGSLMTIEEIGASSAKKT